MEVVTQRFSDRDLGGSEKYNVKVTGRDGKSEAKQGDKRETVCHLEYPILDMTKSNSLVLSMH